MEYFYIKGFKMKLYTIGYSGKKEDDFFEILQNANVSKLIDVRRFRYSKFVPFASEINLKKKCKQKYVVMEKLAPSIQLLKSWQNGDIAWSYYERVYLEYLTNIKAETLFTESFLDNACFLCMEKEPIQCHRRLLAEYLSSKFKDVEIIHL